VALFLFSVSNKNQFQCSCCRPTVLQLCRYWK